MMTVEQKPCPNCGYCPTCGRPNQYQLWPVWPYPQTPIWQWPTWISATQSNTITGSHSS